MNFLLFGLKPNPSEQQESITLTDRIVPYTIKRHPRRRLSLTIDHRGLRVLGPMGLSVRQAEALIMTHESWVAQKLDDWRSERLNRAWTIHGTEPLPIFGNPYTVHILPQDTRTPKIESTENTVFLYTKYPDEAHRNQRALVAWLRSKAIEYFHKRLQKYADLLQVTYSEVSLSQARTRWGSCTSAGHIRLNWRLIHLPQHLVDYVIVHELAHLKEMNHSPQFWAVVESVYPEHKEARKALKSKIAILPVIETSPLNV